MQMTVFEYCRWQNCYWNDVNIETETELKLFLKNFIETRTENNSAETYTEMIELKLYRN